ncbi:hypothetical protein KP509_05G052800 [Ceratopteris richardii]|uniref:Uncharacterized protein n=1 Tax=Ceratopteris richardii TaxID=49495 RepID=A0A8T2UT05_CERRI|nr:hypothetical protein KP509_05G052800 [Ceratopteris richardii]
MIFTAKTSTHRCSCSHLSDVSGSSFSSTSSSSSSSHMASLDEIGNGYAYTTYSPMTRNLHPHLARSSFGSPFCLTPRHSSCFHAWQGEGTERIQLDYVSRLKLRVFSSSSFLLILLAKIKRSCLRSRNGESDQIGGRSQPSVGVDMTDVAYKGRCSHGETFPNAVDDCIDYIRRSATA